MTDERRLEFKNRAPGEDPVIILDLGYWADQEARIQEVSTVTPTKAGELLSAFNRACLDLDRLGNRLEQAHQASVRYAERVRGEVILDKVPKILIEKGLVTSKSPMGSEDIRSAILSQDKEYEAAQDEADSLKAAVKIVRGKFDAFERAFRSVRTLVGEQSFNFGSMKNPNLTGGTGTREPGQLKPPPPGFGKARYGNS